MNFIPRVASEILKQYLQDTKVTMILGARQVGKTTLVNHYIKDEKFILLNLDILADSQRFLALAALEPKDVLVALDTPELVILDEAQNVPETGKIVKGWYDKNLPFKIVLLGSSTLDLLDVAAEPLTGRNEKIYLPPLLFSEIVQAQDWYPNIMPLPESYIEKFKPTLQSLILERMVFGSYPEVVESPDKKACLENLVGDYLLKDTLKHGLVKNPEHLSRLLQLLAHQVGSEVSLNELSTTLGLSRPAVERSLDLLEKSFVIFKLSAFSRNPRNEVIGKKKYYFWDTGVRNEILREFSQSEFRTDIGALWENWVIAEVMKYQVLKGHRSNIEFWRSRNGSEVDLVVREDEKIWAYEMKWSKSKTSGARGFVEEYGAQIQVINKDNAFRILTTLPF